MEFLLFDTFCYAESACKCYNSLASKPQPSHFEEALKAFDTAKRGRKGRFTVDELKFQENHVIRRRERF